MSQLMTYDEKISRLNFDSRAGLIVSLGGNTESEVKEFTSSKNIIETRLYRLGKESPALKVRTNIF